jgi:hypothetical protein
MSSWSEFLANVSSPTTPSLSVPAVVASPPLVNRHLLLVEVADNISRSEIAKCKRENTDVIYVSRETVPLLYGQLQDFNMKWRSINLLFHGSADLEEKSITMFGVKMTMDRSIMMDDPNVVNWVRLLKTISIFASDSIYIYTCAIGMIDGLKELCIHLDKACNLKHGIYLSTNNTGQAPNGDWRMEWGTKTGFLIDGIHTNEIEHAENNLFDDIDGLTFELALLTATTGNTSATGGMTAAQIRALNETQIGNLTRTLFSNFTAAQLQALTIWQIDDIRAWDTGTRAFAIRGVVPNIPNPTGMNVFTVAQMPHFNPMVLGQLTFAQVASLVSTKIQALQQHQIRGFSTNADPTGQIPIHALRMSDFNTAALIQSLSTTQIPALSEGQINALSATQIGQLLDAQFNTLISTQFGWMSSAQITAITTARIRSLSFDKIQAISTVADAAGLKPVNALRMSDFNTAALVQSLSVIQIQHLLDAQINALPPTQTGQLLKVQFKSLLLSRQITVLSDAQFNALTSDQFGWMTSTFVAAITTARIQSLSIEKIQAISTLVDDAGTDIPVNALRMADFNTVALIQSLSAVQIQNLSDAQINALPPTQIGQLSEVQFKGLLPRQITVLSDIQFNALTSDRFGWMSYNQVAAITTARIQSLSIEKIQAISTFVDDIDMVPANALRMSDFNTAARIQSLSLYQIRSLSKQQINALSTAISLLSDEQFNALHVIQFSFMHVGQTNVISETRKNSLSENKKAMLDAITQFSGMRKTDLSAFNQLYYRDLRQLDKLVSSNSNIGEALMILNGTTFVPMGGIGINQLFYPDNFVFSSITVPDKSIKYLHADVYKRIMEYAAADINSIFGTICLYAFKSERLYGNRINTTTIPTELFNFI